MTKLTKDLIREWRRVKGFELTEESFKRLEKQEDSFLSAVSELQREEIDGIFKLVVNSTLARIKNKELRNALKRVVFEMNDETPHEGLIDLNLTESYMAAIDALGGHAESWEHIIAQNTIEALTDDASTTTEGVAKIKQRIKDFWDKKRGD
jgi:hypothetical protein